MTPMHLQNWELHYQPANRLLWRGRIDYPDRPTRFHEACSCVDLREEPLDLDAEAVSYGFIGFACDEGIRRNQGRVGAAKGPEACKQALANAPTGPHEHLKLYDFGSIGCHDANLESAQDALAHVVNLVIRKGVRPIVIGGGHETAWGHFQGIAQAYPNSKIGIINFDAHYDLRPLGVDGQGTSGTSFLQIADYCKAEDLPFDYTVIGLQPISNTDALHQSAVELGTHIITAEQLFSGQQEKAFEAIDAAVERNDLVYCTLCMDVFGASFAPGVSAPQAFGLNPWHIVPLVKRVAESGKAISFDVCELSPVHDRDGATASLAAAMIATYVHHGGEAF